MSRKIVLYIIIFIAAFLRFFQLGSNPPSLTWDEVAWGYNAYSLGIDAKDEFGRLLPVDYLESFGDFKPPVYAYLDILPIKIFGLNEFSVRFPSALFGVLTVVITYFLVRRIFGSYENLALVSSFLLAISPWHVNLSRAAFEANIATFFLVSGVWLFLEGIQKKKWYLPFSAVSFILSMYAFNTARIVAPLLLIVLMIGFRKKLLEQKKSVFVAFLAGAILSFPLGQFILTPQAQLRFREVNIFSDTSIVQRANQEIANDDNRWWSKIIHNRRIAYGILYVQHYFDNFNPRFLFIDGDGNPKFSTRDVGQLYLWELPFLVAGMLLIFKKREGNWWIVPAWLLLAIVPAATARETPHALRIETTLPTFQILTAYGLVIFFNKISNIPVLPAGRKTKYFIFALCFSFLIFNFLYYYHGYYAHYPRQFSGEWQYGYKEAIAYMKSVESRYDKIYFTEALGRPYAYILFYTGYSPKVFRKEAIVEREVYGFVHVRGFGKYHFAKNFDRGEKQGIRVLYFDNSQQVPKGANILRTFSLLNGNPSLVAYTL